MKEVSTMTRLTIPLTLPTSSGMANAALTRFIASNTSDMFDSSVVKDGQKYKEEEEVSATPSV
jgi:uncharacterized protein YggU (UPF0235/DUF167 family)